MKKSIRICSGLLCGIIFLGNMQVFAKNTVIKEEVAKEAAWEIVPSSCSFLTTDLERYFYEVKYFDKTNQQKYTVQVGKNKGDILQFTIESLKTAGKNVKITKESAEQTIRNLYSNAVDIKAVLCKENGLCWYDVTYLTPTINGIAKVDAQSGKILKRDDLYFQAKDEELRDIVKIPTTKKLLSEEKILELANKEIPGGKVERIQLVGNKTLYEVKISKSNYDYDMLYNAFTGAKQSRSSNKDSVNSSDEYISREQAIKTAKSMAPGKALLKSMSLKRSGDQVYYEGWLKLDGIRYSFRIDAVSGSVIHAGTEVDETWDSNAHHDIDSVKDEDENYEMKLDD